MKIQNSFSNKKNNLYIIATPIGDLEEFNSRALKILRECNCIIVESKRKSFLLFSYWKINLKGKKIYYLKSKNENNNFLFSDDYDYCLLSDNGYPLVCDPGYKVVNEFRKKNYNVIVINGPSPIIASLIVSSFPVYPFYFQGFLPKKELAAKNLIINLFNKDCTVVTYVSKHRLLFILGMMESINKNKKIAIVKDLTRSYEEIFIGNVAELKEEFVKLKVIKGEYIIVINNKQ